MKNLRKVLAFVLCVAMMASFMISASAMAAKEFSDYTTIQNTDAVAMLTELGIINGYPTGDFKPEGTVTRAEMAKMIYVVLNAGSDAAPTPDAQRYTDVWDGMWCEGYVAFCDDCGIIAGYGDGKFGPSDTVTAVQAAKMLLVAMGFDPVKEGFTGTNWDYNVLKVASANGLFENFDAAVNDGCTRDNAALLIYNALIADEVSYVGDTAITNGKTLLGEYFNIVAVTGVVVANEYANLFGNEALRKGYTEIAYIGDQYVDDDHAIDPEFEMLGYTHFGSGSNAPYFPTRYDVFDMDEAHYQGIQTEDLNGYTAEAVYWNRKRAVNDYDEYQSQIFEVSTDLSEVGKTVTIYAKLKSNIEYYYVSLLEYFNYEYFSGKVIGNVVENDKCVVKTYDGKSYEEFDYKALKKEGFSFDSTTRYFVNYAMSWYGGMDPVRYWDTYSNNAYFEPRFYDGQSAIEYNLPGEYTELVDVDGDGIIEIVLKQRDILAVAQYDKYHETWDFTCNEAGEDYGYYDVDPDFIVKVGDEEFADNDVVLVNFVDGMFYVEKAAYVEGVPTVVDYANKDYPFITLDGTDYIESGIYWICEDACAYYDKDNKNVALQSDITKMSATSKDKYRVYFDSMGNVVAYIGVPKGPKPAAALALLTASYIDGSKFTYGLTMQNDNGITLYNVGVNKYGDVENDDVDFFVGYQFGLDDINFGYYVGGALYCPQTGFRADLVNHFAYKKVFGKTLTENSAQSDKDLAAQYAMQMANYGFGLETALVGIEKRGDDVNAAQLAAPAGPGEPVDFFVNLTDPVTHLKQRAFAADMPTATPGQTATGYVYATKDTAFFVYTKTTETYKGKGPYQKDYLVTKVYSFTGYEGLGQFNDLECSYALVDGKEGNIAKAIVFEATKDQLTEAADFAYVCGLMAQVGDKYQVLYINGKGELKTMLADADSDCFLTGPDKVVYGFKKGLYVIDGTKICSGEKYIGVTGYFAIDKADVTAFIKSEYFAYNDGEHPVEYFELTENTKYYIAVYYKTEAGYYYRKVIECNGSKAMYDLIGKLDDDQKDYERTDSDKNPAEEVKVSSTWVALFEQAVDGTYVDNNVTAIIGSAYLGSKDAVDEIVGRSDDLSYAESTAVVVEVEEVEAAVEGTEAAEAPAPGAPEGAPATDPMAPPPQA